MERRLFMGLSVLARQLGPRRTRGIFSNADIVIVFLWSVLHDRPVRWATEEENWPDDLRPRRIPSQSAMSRRLRSQGVTELLLAIEQHFVVFSGMIQHWVRVIDAKPLAIGGNSKDPDAGYGRGAGGMQKGYKLYAVWGSGPVPLAWGLAGMNTSEKTMARQLIPTLPGEGYLMGDTEYDSNPLFELAAQNGYQLVTPKRQRHRGVGHRKQSPHRLRCLELKQKPFGKKLSRFRGEIERCFGNCTSFGGGLAPLPNWVRRIHRVRLWLEAKLLINAARICRAKTNWTLATA